MTEPKSNVTSGEILVDARGHRCPVPTLRLRRALAEASAGVIVRLIADDPMAPIDVPHFVAEGGFEILDEDETGGVFTFRVRVAERGPERTRRAVGGNDAPPG